LLALVMGANVLLRYGFSLGWIWAQELEWHLLVPICLFGMSYALRHGEHVRVDILFASSAPAPRWWSNSFRPFWRWRSR
jgi:TRAP-type C4-dicarboxylate transport system permease small subunit